jgi:hypothetical protein
MFWLLNDRERLVPIWACHLEEPFVIDGYHNWSEVGDSVFQQAVQTGQKNFHLPALKPFTFRHGSAALGHCHRLNLFDAAHTIPSGSGIGLFLELCKVRFLRRAVLRPRRSK